MTVRAEESQEVTKLANAESCGWVPAEHPGPRTGLRLVLRYVGRLLRLNMYGGLRHSGFSLNQTGSTIRQPLIAVAVGRAGAGQTHRVRFDRPLHRFKTDPVHAIGCNNDSGGDDLCYEFADHAPNPETRYAQTEAQRILGTAITVYDRTSES